MNQELAQDIQQLQDVQQLQQQQNVQTAQSLAQINEIVAQINLRLQNMEDLLTTRLYNAAASCECQLLYPPAITVDPAIPKSKCDLLDLSATQCNAAARALGLTHLAPDATVDQRRQQISDYLGCAMLLGR